LVGIFGRFDSEQPIFGQLAFADKPAGELAERGQAQADGAGLFTGGDEFGGVLLDRARVSSTGCSHHSRYSRTPRKEVVMVVGDLFSASRLISHEFSSPWRSSAGKDLFIPIYLLGDACRNRRLNQDRVQA
jgi:hypothetical protein